MNDCGMCQPGIAFEYTVPSIDGGIDLNLRLQHEGGKTLVYVDVFDAKNKRAVYYDTHLPAKYCFECGRKLAESGAE